MIPIPTYVNNIIKFSKNPGKFKPALQVEQLLDIAQYMALIYK
jgi:hypothetical protein